MKKIITVLFCAAVLATASSAHAQEGPQKPAQIAEFEKAGWIVDYLGNALGLEGWVMLSPDKVIRTVYTNEKGALVLGVLMDDKGNNLTGPQLEAFKARAEGGQGAVPGADKSGLSKTEQVYAEVEKSNWVAVGSDKAPYIYMFMNVTCEHCQKFWRDLQRAIDTQQVQVRLIPFGKLEANRNAGAALLSVENPQAAYNDYLSGKKESLGVDKIKDGTFEKMDANTKLFGDRKMQGPPFTLYRRPADGSVAAVVGAPDNVLLILADLVK